MALTEARAEMLANYLTADKDRAAKLLGLSPEEALAQMNADGNDFTLEELGDFNEALKAALAEEGELDADALDDVAGGSAALTILGVGFAVKVAYDVGRTVGKNAPW